MAYDQGQLSNNLFNQVWGDDFLVNPYKRAKYEEIQVDQNFLPDQAVQIERVSNQHTPRYNLHATDSIPLTIPIRNENRGPFRFQIAEPYSSMSTHIVFSEQQENALSYLHDFAEKNAFLARTTGDKHSEAVYRVGKMGDKELAAQYVARALNVLDLFRGNNRHVDPRVIKGLLPLLQAKGLLGLIQELLGEAGDEKQMEAAAEAGADNLNNELDADPNNAPRRREEIPEPPMREMRAIPQEEDILEATKQLRDPEEFYDQFSWAMQRLFKLTTAAEPEDKFEEDFSIVAPGLTEQDVTQIQIGSTAEEDEEDEEKGYPPPNGGDDDDDDDDDDEAPPGDGEDFKTKLSRQVLARIPQTEKKIVVPPRPIAERLMEASMIAQRSGAVSYESVILPSSLKRSPERLAGIVQEILIQGENNSPKEKSVISKMLSSLMKISNPGLNELFEDIRDRQQNQLNDLERRELLKRAAIANYDILATDNIFVFDDPDRMGFPICARIGKQKLPSENPISRILNKHDERKILVAPPPPPYPLGEGNPANELQGVVGARLVSRDQYLSTLLISYYYKLVHEPFKKRIQALTSALISGYRRSPKYLKVIGNLAALGYGFVLIGPDGTTWIADSLYNLLKVFTKSAVNAAADAVIKPTTAVILFTGRMGFHLTVDTLRAFAEAILYPTLMGVGGIGAAVVGVAALAEGGVGAAQDYDEKEVDAQIQEQQAQQEEQDVEAVDLGIHEGQRIIVAQRMNADRQIAAQQDLILEGRRGGR